MNTDFADSIRLIQSERGITEDLVLATIEEFLMAAYKKTFGTSENAVVRFSESGGDVAIYAKKIIVEDDDLYDPVSQIELAEALEPGESVVIELDFILGIPTEMGGNYGLFGYFDDVLVLDVFYPVIPAYDEDGWYSQHPQQNGDLTYQDASFYLVQVKAPADLTLVSSGVAVDHQEDGNQQTVVFAAGPARDFYLAGSREFVELKEQVGDLTVKVHTKKEYPLHQGYALDYSLKAIEILSERVGDYPYTEFEVMSSPMRALGIEYPGMTSIVVDEFVAGEVMYGLPTENILESTLAHEVGHAWFYNVVGNDQQNEPWVDEALVQYLTYIYYKKYF